MKKQVKKSKVVIHKDETIALFDEIIEDIAINGKPVRKALEGKMAFGTFYTLLNDDPERLKRYARATEIRTEVMAQEIEDIADESQFDIYISDETGQEITNHEVIARSRLRVDTRKWLLSKMNPKKYGDKIEVDTTITNKAGSIKALFPTQDEVKEDNQ